jgi:hypothetical protein
MATKEETKTASDPVPQRPGLEPGAQLRGGQEERRYGPESPQQERPAVPGSQAALKAEIMAELRAAGVLPGGKGPSPEQEAEEANRRARERMERRSRDLEEHTKRLALYKARGSDTNKPAGEIPGELPGSGRRLVMQGEVFRFAGDPGTWMEPLDEQGKERTKAEEERRERVIQQAGETKLGVEALKVASDSMQRLTLGRERRAADAHEHRAGAGG